MMAPGFRAGRSGIIAIPSVLVPPAIAADGVTGREDIQQVSVELFGRDGRQPACAGQAVAFLVDQPVIPPKVIRLEDQLKMINDFLVGQLSKTARALSGDHAIILLLSVLCSIKPKAAQGSR
jgi:hypothetical protein